MPVKGEKWALRVLKMVLDAREGGKIGWKGIDRASRYPWRRKNRLEGN
jgi:hypothetical protein